MEKSKAGREVCWPGRTGGLAWEKRPPESLGAGAHLPTEVADVLSEERRCSVRKAGATSTPDCHTVTHNWTLLSQARGRTGV